MHRKQIPRRFVSWIISIFLLNVIINVLFFLVNAHLNTVRFTVTAELIKAACKRFIYRKNFIPHSNSTLLKVSNFNTYKKTPKNDGIPHIKI